MHSKSCAADVEERVTNLNLVPEMKATTSERRDWTAVRIIIIFHIISIAFAYRPSSPRAVSICSIERKLLFRKQELNINNYRVKSLLDSENSVVTDDISVKTTLKQLLRTTSLSTRNGIVIIAGFEAFNVQLYRKAAALVM